MGFSTFKFSAPRWYRILASILLLSGHSYAECNGTIQEPINDGRYTINSDNTVSDPTTHLTWARCSAGFIWSSSVNNCVIVVAEQQQFTWQEALNFAHAAGGSPSASWRLPNTKELESLIKRSCNNPALATNVFSSAPVAQHWTATAAIGYFGNAWVVNFNDGSLITADKLSRYQVRLVKSN